MSDTTPHTPLTSTLTLALVQCQDQIRLLEERAQTIISLQEENGRLKLELDEARSQSKNNELTEEQKVLLEALYQKDTEKQVEIDKLKAKLRKIKVRAQHHGLTDSFSSSPLAPLNEKSSSVQKLKPRAISPSASGRSHEVIATSGSTSAGKGVAEHLASVIPRHRDQNQSPVSTRPLGETSRETRAVTIKEEGDRPPKRKRFSDRVEAAIPSIAEDGEHLWNATRQEVEQKTNEAHTSAYHRLNELMNAPTPQRSVVARSDHARQVDSSIVKGRSPIMDKPVATYDTLDTPARLSRKTRKSLAAGTSTVSLPGMSPVEQDSFRLRPLNQLDLSHFKLNTTANGGVDYAYNEVVRGRQERKCLPGCTKPECCGYKFSVLADTLPKLPSAQGMSDDDLLIQHLGPGSEEKIRTLTVAARENLLHDARTKIIANAYGKMHRNRHDREKSPPGFWSTDMPGSQEEQGLRKQAKTREREVVQRRYEEAMRGDGRWMFADE